MKESVFLKSTKGKVIIIAAAAVLVAVITVIILLLSGGETGYRNISISQIYGNVMAENGGNEYKAYENMRLADGYVLTTGEDSYVRLALDDDKYVKLGQESRAVFTNVGNANSHVTAITVEFGTITAEVVNPLTDEESFVVTTPNAVLAVRGTMFKVGVSRDESGNAVTEAYTFGGTVSCRPVLPDGTVSDEEVMITQGSKSCIESDGNTVSFSGAAVVPISIDDISDEDMVDIYNASSHGHAMFLETAELWQEIADRDIDLSEYRSAYDSGEVPAYIENGESTSGSDTAETSGSQSEETSGTTTSATVPEAVPEPVETTVTVPEAAAEPTTSVTTAPAETSTVSSTAAAVPEVTPKPAESKPAATASQTTTTEKAKPETTTPGTTTPGTTTPGTTTPGTTKPEITTPGTTKPEETKPEETKPEETKPEETKPEPPKPDDPPVHDHLYVENGSITITETGYIQGDGEEVAYTGDYVIRQKNPDVRVNDFYITVESGRHNITVEGLNVYGNRGLGIFFVAGGASVNLSCEAENTIVSDYSAIQNFGEFEISGGSLSVSGSLGIFNNGSFVISGGLLTLDCYDLGINNYTDYNYGGATGSFLISGGTITTGVINNFGGWFTVSGGRITADALYNYGGWFTVEGGSITAGTITAEGFTYAFMNVIGGTLRVTGVIPDSIIDSFSTVLECVVYDTYPGSLKVTLTDREYVYKLSAEDAAADGKYYVWLPVERVLVTAAGESEEEPDTNAAETHGDDEDGYLPEEKLWTAAQPEEKEAEKKLPV